MPQIDSRVEPPSAMPDERISAGEQLFETWRKRLGAILTLPAFFLTYVLCSGLRPAGQKLAAILATVTVLWISEVIPLPVSALLGAVPEEPGKSPAAVVLAYFADPIVFVFIGGFMIARAMTIHGLDRRIALGFLSIPWVGSSPARTMVGLGLVTAVISMWVSNSATTAMMLPIALGILRALHDVRVARGLAQDSSDVLNWPFATGMMLMVAFSASIGGIGTPVGSPPNLIGIGLIRSATGIDISFFRWMAVAVPLLLVMGLTLFTLLYLLHPAGKAADRAACNQGDGTAQVTPNALTADIGSHLLHYIRGERSKLGPWTWGQINTVVAFGVAVTLWVMPGIMQLPWLAGSWWGLWMSTHLPESIVAISAAILLFLLPVNLAQWEFTLTWPEAVKIDWGTILLFGGGLALGSLMFKTGVAEAIGNALTRHLGVSSLWGLTGLSTAMAIVMSEAASNTASANMIIPVVIAIAQAAGVNPLPPALGACLGASFGFMLPVDPPQCHRIRLRPRPAPENDTRRHPVGYRRLLHYLGRLVRAASDTGASVTT
ncbi:MAG TPA: SLC13 family permease [Verrucomicrobiae bacterium]|nr:SLC13 family permease [Verrucomicrobiae bacterium]